MRTDWSQCGCTGNTEQREEAQDADRGARMWDRAPEMGERESRSI